MSSDSERRDKDEEEEKVELVAYKAMVSETSESDPEKIPRTSLRIE